MNSASSTALARYVVFAVSQSLEVRQRLSLVRERHSFSWDWEAGIEVLYFHEFRQDIAVTFSPGFS